MMRKFSLSALVAAGLLVGGLSVGSASAADLGGNCCADLEERIAELEATTARKGNRKVSLTISGWIGEQVMWWDDGAARGTYVTGLGTTLSSNVKFTGQATIMPGWYAGYVLHIETDYADPLLDLDQQHNLAPFVPQGLIGQGGVVGNVSVLQSYWFVKSDKLGKVGVGLQSPAGDNAAILVDGSGSLVPANWVMFDNAHFALRVKSTGAFTNGSKLDTTGALRWGNLGFCNTADANIGGDCVSNPWPIVRYDSPVWSGFSFTADWGNDTYWDIYGRYSGEWNGIKIAATTGWSEVNRCGGFAPNEPDCINSEANNLANDVLHPTGDTGYWQSGIYVEHVATGLWFLANYGQEFLRDVPAAQDSTGNRAFVYDDQPYHYYLKAGVRERWSQLGHTVLFGEYAQRHNMVGDTDINTGPAGVPDGGDGGDEDLVRARMTQWGLGVVQEVDAAAMSFWVVYRHFNASATTLDDAPALEFNKIKFDDFQLVKFGALINF